MKKIYKVPTNDVIILKTQMSILTGSDQNIEIGDEYSGGVIGSRRGNLWDDDEY